MRVLCDRHFRKIDCGGSTCVTQESGWFRKDIPSEGNRRYLAGQDDIKIRVPKGRRDELKEIAKDRFNMSLQAFIISADNEKIEREALKNE